MTVLATKCGRVRILLVTPVFYPEPYYLRGLPFVRGLMERGFDVEVLTGFPSYPVGRIYPGYRQRLWQEEICEGVRIIRVPSYLSHDGSGLRRAATYLSMAASMTLLAPIFVRKPDLIHVNQGPATLCLPAKTTASLRKARILLDIQDLWPESVTDSGMLRWSGAVPLLNRWCQWTYRWADHIVTLSPGVRDALVTRGVPQSRITVLYNWCDRLQEAPLPPRGTCEDRYQLGTTFNVIYAGNFGPLQALETVLGAAALLRATNPGVRFVLVGSGLEEASLKRQAAENELDNVRFIPRQPMAQLREILAYADSILVHLRDSPLNRVGIPSKLQHALASGRPVLIGAEGSAAELVRAAGSGIAFEPENAQALAAAVRSLCDMPRDTREAMGQRGRTYYLDHMSFEVGMDRLAQVYRHVCGRG